MSMPWISAMPDHWEKMRAKYLFTKQNRAVREQDDVVTCFRDGIVTPRKIALLIRDTISFSIFLRLL